MLACAWALMSSVANSDWTPPRNPDPSAIFHEAQADARAKRYGDALAKHLWFHENALTYQPSLYGVRLSFALSAWVSLGQEYPPALQALKEVRDRTGSRIRGGSGTHSDFHDFSSINEVLHEQAATAALFVWLDQNNARMADDVYDIAQPALIYAKQYRLCGKYINSQETVQSMRRLYREQLAMVNSGRFGPDIKAYAERSFTHDASTLVALLVLNDRGPEADDIIATVLKDFPDPAFRSQLQQAREGKIPPQWPRSE